MTNTPPIDLYDVPQEAAARLFGEWVERLRVDPRNRTLAQSLTESVIDLLIAGRPTRQMMLMLADFVEAHADQFAKEQLGAILVGRWRADQEERIVIDTFTLALECGLPQDKALQLAYSAYLRARDMTEEGRKDTATLPRKRKHGRSFASDAGVKTEHATHATISNLAARNINDIIRPILKNAGFQLVKRKPPGRPSRKSAGRLRTI